MEDSNSHHVHPLDPAETLNAPSHQTNGKEPLTSLPPADPESAITKAEKVERQGGYEAADRDSPRPTKRIKLEDGGEGEALIPAPVTSERVKGVAPIKAE